MLGELYKVIRLYVNFFQPSMRLLSKSRHGAKTHRLYDEARTPYDRILTSENISKRIKWKLRQEYQRLDPVQLLSEIERLQDELWSYADKEIGMRSNRANRARNDLRQYAAAGGDGQEVFPESVSQQEPINVEEPTRPKRTYRKSKGKRKKVVHWWRTRPDVFETVWEDIELWLEDTPYLASNLILKRLQAKYPDHYPDNKLRTLQRRVKAWRLSQIEGSEHELSTGDSLPDAETIELVVRGNCRKLRFVGGCLL